MDWKVGEIKQINGEMYQCVEGICNKECYFYNRSLHKTIAGINGDGFGACNAAFRSDDKSVIFKKLKKVGKPYEYFMQGTGIILVQEYILASQSYICGDEVIDCQKDGRIAIEIKQNKEDMEEKKIQHYDCFFNEKSSKHKLKPFDLEAAKSGKPICTRDGRKARIICFDANGEYPLIALITLDNDAEDIKRYTVGGRYYGSSESNSDLMMLPEKKWGWVNVYNNPDIHGIYTSANVFENKEMAEELGTSKNRIAICKISWEE